MTGSPGWLAMQDEASIDLASPPPPIVVIRREAVVDALADEVWRRIGDFRAVISILGADCSYVSGSGDVGSVRSIRGGAVLEPMIARTERSYTYVQSKGPYADYGYHGTIAVEPDEGGSRLVYTIVFDGAAMPMSSKERLVRQIEERAVVVVEEIRLAVEGGSRDGGTDSRQSPIA